MGVQESKRAPEAERILVGSGIGAEAKEWSRLWQAEGREGPFQTEGKKREGAGKRIVERWLRDASCFYPTNTHARPLCTMQQRCSVILRDTDEAAKSERVQSGEGPGGHIQSSVLRARGKLGNHKLGSTVFQVPLLQSMHSAAWQGARAPPARASQQEAFANSLGKRWWQLGLGT